ncbi:D-alanyl-lipoteichoic acid biosynthesis protein DltD [Eupransor demetentiae]|uniref:Involved in esterification of teichoic acids (DltD) n=1 Tax=Eupransor demetentiae TaxID=3109584 RepID=A0ABP0EQI0_9LACO|nr:Poly-D-alanine transfer protein DltD [Lactobacillaceae bacterium LMG 33000]
MSNRKKLWWIFGPVIIAFALVGAVFLSPFPLTHFSQTELRNASVTATSNIIKGEAVKTAAFSDKSTRYVPFFGSSELQRFDTASPAVLASKYNRNYRPFFLGRPDTNSLVHFLSMQEMRPALHKKQAVYIISPQWFIRNLDQDKQVNLAFEQYYSPLQAVEWLLNIDKVTPTDRYIAGNVLQRSPIKNNLYYSKLITKIKNGQELSGADISSLKLQQRILSREDQFFTNFSALQSLTNNASNSGHSWNSSVVPNEKLLPDEYNLKEIEKVVDEQAALNTTSNRFLIKNSFYRSNGLQRKLPKPGFQVGPKYDYRQSAEYANMQAVLQQFKDEDTDVLFIITPVNKRWIDYTGLSQKKYDEAAAKIKYQLQSQGFNNIADFSRDGGKKYFTQDTIHIGWRGWLTADQSINPFLSNGYKQPSYKMNNRFLSEDWQNYLPTSTNIDFS